MKKVIFSILICLLSIQVGFANTELMQAIEQVKESGWAISECYYNNVDAEKVNDATIVYNRNIENCAELIFSRGLQKEFQEYYNELDDYNKGLLNPVVELLTPATKEYGADTTPFPGYGYPEPGYNYRRGAELNREFLSAFWRNEERYLETNQENELTIELKFLADFTNGIKNEGQGEVKSMENVNINVGGELKEAVRIKYTIKKTLRVTCQVKFQKTKVWFELFKQEKAPWYAPWQNNDWEKCGETYNIVEEATGEEVGASAPTLVDEVPSH